MSVEVRLLSESELVLANEFYNNTYKTNRTFKNFQWEFINGPAGKAIYVAAIDSSAPSVKIVGIQCAIPLELQSSDGSIIRTAKSEDTLVDPAYRGQKLFERMYDLLFEECRKAGIQYIWGFTPAVKAFQRIGFQIPFRTTQALLVLKPIPAFGHLSRLNPANTQRDRMKILGLSFFSWMKGNLSRFRTPHLTYKAVSYYEKDNLIKSLYSEKAWYFLRQNDPYNDWRMAQNPFGNDYTNLVFSKDGATVADAIINVRSDVSYIEQILCADTLNDRQRSEIVSVLIRHLKSSGTALIRVLCFTNSHEGKRQIEALKKSGFTYLDRGNYFVWKSLSEKESISTENLVLSRLFTQGNL